MRIRQEYVSVFIMHVRIFLKRLVSKFFVSRKSIIQRRLRNRNLRIVEKQPLDLRHFQDEVLLPDGDTILKLAQECFSFKGYYPISFSWPRDFEEPQNPKSNALSTTVPYVPYSFDEVGKYYGEYANSTLAITHKKGGWDCFRHLEIIGAGCIPLFLDIEKIPKYTMVLYPKDLFKVVRKNFRKRSLLPSQDVAVSLIKYANKNLTSQAMCRYFSELSNLSVTHQDIILFVDSKLSSAPDYLSVFNFIGLKQVFGDQVRCLYEEPDYVYVDSTQDVSELYGRGFGYTKVLNREFVELNSTNSPKFLIISNLERDFRLLKNLKIEYPAAKFVMFWGADKPITTEIKEEVLRLTQGILFCREIY